VARELLVFAHNFVVVIAVWAFFGILPGPEALLAVLGIAINAFVVFWLSVVLGVVSVRYRDVPPIMQSLVNVLFFVTPVLWTTERLGDNADIVVLLNPVAYLIEIVRNPLLGHDVPASTWIVVLCICISISSLGLLVMAATRRRLTHWL
jgi:ABC-type polysaccharide/polyol phosphate export permease